MSIEVQVAVAKINKWAVSESGDTFEMVERPYGGLSFVLVDGQSSGKGAKSVSNIVARKATALLGEGVRDGAAARAAHDYLYTLRQGKVSATLNMVSVDLASNTIVVSRNTHCPVLIGEGLRVVNVLDEPSEAIGIHLRTKPSIHELSIRPDITIVAFTDGVLSAGSRIGESLDLLQFVQERLARQAGAQAIADELLAEAVQFDEGRPADDISVMVVATRESTVADLTRRMSVSFPIG